MDYYFASHVANWKGRTWLRALVRSNLAMFDRKHMLKE